MLTNFNLSRRKVNINYRDGGAGTIKNLISGVKNLDFAYRKFAFEFERNMSKIG